MRSLGLGWRGERRREEERGGERREEVQTQRRIGRCERMFSAKRIRSPRLQKDKQKENNKKNKEHGTRNK